MKSFGKLSRGMQGDDSDVHMGTHVTPSQSHEAHRGCYAILTWGHMTLSHVRCPAHGLMPNHLEKGRGEMYSTILTTKQSYSQYMLRHIGIAGEQLAIFTIIFTVR
jgi:hypothetical protein